jgi:protein TIF31
MKVLYDLHIPGVNVLHMIIINYRGFRMIAQSIIPGILSSDQNLCSQYGSIDDGKTL